MDEAASSNIPIPVNASNGVFQFNTTGSWSDHNLEETLENRKESADNTTQSSPNLPNGSNDLNAKKQLQLPQIQLCLVQI